MLFFPIIIFVTTFANEGLYYWLGEDFASSSTKVVHLISLGVFFNSFAQVPYGFIQSQGRPDLTAKLHILELPVYLVGLWLMIFFYGIDGAAFAWMIRAFIDMIGLFGIVVLLKKDRFAGFRQKILIKITAIILILTSFFISGLLVKIIFLIMSIGIFVPIIWFCIFDNEDREIVTKIRTYVRPKIVQQ
jgi:O-antigen/teichoic acid export membrane protein